MTYENVRCYTSYWFVGAYTDYSYVPGVKASPILNIVAIFSMGGKGGFPKNLYPQVSIYIKDNTMIETYIFTALLIWIAYFLIKKNPKK